jgi:PAS domain S-box-containing protein
VNAPTFDVAGFPLHQLLELSWDAVIGADPDGSIRLWSPAAERLFGYGAGEVTGRSLAILSPPEQRRSPILEAVRSGRRFHSLRSVQCRKDGTRFEAALAVTPARDGQDRVSGSLIVLRETRELATHEALLHECAELLHCAKKAYFVRDLQGRVLAWSKGAEELYGWRTDDVVGKKDHDLFGAEAAAAYRTGTRNAVRNGSWAGQLLQRTRSGREMLVESRWVLLGSQDGKEPSIVVQNADLSTRSRLEKEVRYVERLRSVGSFAAGVAHDLNNLLAPVLMSVDVLRGMVREAEGTRILASVERCVERSIKVLNQMLRLSATAEGERAEVQVRHLIYELRNFIHTTFPESIEVTTDYSQDLPTVNAEPTQLYQLLLNLCFNARDAMVRGGMLTIKAERVDRHAAALSEHAGEGTGGAASGAFVRISVSDTGTGMPPHVMKRIFDPFYSTKEPGQGAGLGLSLVRSIARAHGGFVEVSSRVGEGSTFDVYLPAAAEAAS